VMRSASTSPFPGLSEYLSRGAPAVSTTKKKGRRSLAHAKMPVYAAIVEGTSIARGQLGVAAVNPATKDFHIFSFVDSSYASLQTLLQELDPTEVLIDESTSKDLHDAVTTTCHTADVFTVKRKFFEGGLARHRKLSNRSCKLVDSTGKEECLSAFSALVQFTEHATKSVLSRSSLSISLHEKSLSMVCPTCEMEGSECEMKSLAEIREHFAHNHWQVHGY
ncbi:hypothetical protein PMAYCL1PPCAC_11667, partial [Pristionchus mayeri]